MELNGSDLLNPEQFRSVEITLRMFEENLRLISTWLDGKEENGILYRRELNFPSGTTQGRSPSDIDACFEPDCDPGSNTRTAT